MTRFERVLGVLGTLVFIYISIVAVRVTFFDWRPAPVQAWVKNAADVGFWVVFLGLFVVMVFGLGRRMRRAARQARRREQATEDYADANPHDGDGYEQ